jgi:type IV secretory pathway VirB10-like protein
MSRSLIAGLLAFGLLACAGAQGKDTSGTGGAAADAASASPRVLSNGSAVAVTIQDAISSRTNTVGQHVNGVVSDDVMDDAGLVVIPSGSPVVLTITELGPALNSGQKDGAIELRGTSVTVAGTTYELGATVGTVPHTLEGRGITKSAVGNVAVGTAVGAAVGQAIGKDQKSTIIGGAIGAVAGGARAATIADRDVVVASGTRITLTLTRSLTITSN